VFLEICYADNCKINLETYFRLRKTTKNLSVNKKAMPHQKIRNIMFCRLAKIRQRTLIFQ